MLSLRDSINIFMMTAVVLTGAGSFHMAVTIDGLTMQTGKSLASLISKFSARCFVYV